ncbi:MAG: hypothetical protein ACRDGV_12345 [Candidatus Limnocylindria bacterium]
MSARDKLANEPFSWTVRADGTVIISYHAAPVTALRGQRASRFLERVAVADVPAAQQLMARATGQFKRGNERVGKQRRT